MTSVDACQVNILGSDGSTCNSDVMFTYNVLRLKRHSSTRYLSWRLLKTQWIIFIEKDSILHNKYIISQIDFHGWCSVYSISPGFMAVVYFWEIWSMFRRHRREASSGVVLPGLFNTVIGRTRGEEGYLDSKLADVVVLAVRIFLYLLFFSLFTIILKFLIIWDND